MEQPSPEALPLAWAVVPAMLAVVPAFVCESLHRIRDLGLSVERYALPGGMLHLHLACADPHRACAVGFRTPPEDDSGAPHILEHTVLCGSRRYPVRDPFFAMLRRSQATYLNAITWPDLTCYPFATLIPADFDHLLRVYLDAVFAPLLDALDFAQEGHRLVFSPEGPQRQGVVYNEMKGAFTTSADYLDLALGREVLGETSRRFDSGGLPEAIPRLSHDRLRDLHATWYTPANACLVTYGAVDCQAVHRVLAPYLDSGAGMPLPAPALQTRPSRPRRIEVPVPRSPTQAADEVGCWSRIWQVGDARDLDALFDLDLLDELLIGHAGSPLRRALEASGLGASLGDTGVDAGQPALLYHLRYEGVDPDAYAAVGSLVDAELARLAETGFTAAARNAALHQAEIAHRDHEEDGEPFGVTLGVRALQLWNLGIDVATGLDGARRLRDLRRRWQDAAYGRVLLRRLLIDNPARTDLLARPDPDFHQRQRTQEAAACFRDAATADSEALRRTAEALHARQTAAHDFSALPTLTVADLPGRRRWSEAVTTGPWIFTPPCNGLVTRILVIDAAAIPVADQPLLPILALALGNLGVGRRRYAQQAAYASRRCTGISAWFDAAPSLDVADQGTLLIGLETTGLARRRRDLGDLLDETWTTTRFDEIGRLRELLDEAEQGLRDDLGDDGNRLAAWAARAGLGGAGAWAHHLEGIGHLHWLRACRPADDADLAARLADLHARLREAPWTWAEIGDGARADAGDGGLRRAGLCDGPAATGGSATFFAHAGAVNHHAWTLPTVRLGHDDAPALAVAAQILTQRYLLPRLREQGGAYGASASANGASGTFTMTSYRDPRTTATQADFDAAATWFADLDLSDEALREGILAAVAAIDQPSGRVAEASDRFLADLRGDGPERIDPFRARILTLDAATIQAAVARHLRGSPRRAVLADPERAGDFAGWDQVAL